MSKKLRYINMFTISLHENNLKTHNMTNAELIQLSTEELLDLNKK
jgi:hypothetical protein